MLYTYFAALVVAVYEYFLTLGDEISLVWSTQWSFTKVLFLVNRYLLFVDGPLLVQANFYHSDLISCITKYRVAMYIFTVGVTIPGVLLAVRTYAIWRSKRVVLYILIFLQIGFLVGGLVVAHEALQIHLVIAVLTIIQQRRAADDLPQVSPLVKTLYRDGLVFYLAMLAFSVANLCVMQTAPSALFRLLHLPLRVLHSVLCTRMLLNLRKSVMGKQETAFTALSMQVAAQNDQNMELPS
ncbi:hypothetical protein OBBRIDRAFT_347294 [Obba rivulosa]|uniref:DUF6533 domain-containing protein n=1 Tax=Obba rivulosa TaxID=1052685 RepID=A0A8E2DGN3_9APHY|nr:hypothetical protein OBBRIDRAFT_347294 [Obba rivulosa]